MSISKRRLIQSAIAASAVGASPALADDAPGPTSFKIKCPRDAHILTLETADASEVTRDQALVKLADAEERQASALATASIERVKAVARLLSPELVDPLIQLANDNASHLGRVVTLNENSVKNAEALLASGEGTRIDLARLRLELADSLRALVIGRTELDDMKFKIDLYGRLQREIESHLDTELRLRERALAFTVLRAPANGIIKFNVDGGTFAKKGVVLAEVIA